MLETVRQYALEKLGESGEADTVRTGHRDHYTAMAAPLDMPAHTDHQQLIEQAETEIDNLRAAFTWSRDNHELALALELASSLQPLWMVRARMDEGAAWFDAVLTDENMRDVILPPAARVRALADKATLDAMRQVHDHMAQAQELPHHRSRTRLPSPRTPALTACGGIGAYDAEVARPYFAEAVGLARTVGDNWRLSQILAWQTFAAVTGEGNPDAVRATGEEGRDLADAIGDRFNSRMCRWCLALERWWRGDLVGAVAQCRDLVDETEEAHDELW